MSAGHEITLLEVREQILKAGMTAHATMRVSNVPAGQLACYVYNPSTGWSTTVYGPSNAAVWVFGLTNAGSGTWQLTPQIVSGTTVLKSGASVYATWIDVANGTSDGYLNSAMEGCNARLMVPAATATSGTVTEYIGLQGSDTSVVYNAWYFAKSLNGTVLTTNCPPNDWCQIGWSTNDSFSLALSSTWNADGPYKFQMTGYAAPSSNNAEHAKAFAPTFVFNGPSNPYGGVSQVLYGDMLTLTGLGSGTTVYWSYIGLNDHEYYQQQSAQADSSGSLSIPANRQGAIEILTPQKFWVNVTT